MSRSRTTDRAIEPGPLDIECWRPIDGWPGYEVSDWGRVLSYWAFGGKGQGQRGIGLTPKIIGGYRVQSGHRTAVLYRGESREKRTVGVHVLVLEAFVGPRPSRMEACHDDGNPGNNRLGNLRWDTPSANQIDRLRHGASNTAKLSATDIAAIWVRLVDGDEQTGIARDYDLSSAAIAGLKSGRNWSHITSKLPGWPLVPLVDAATIRPVHPSPKFCDDTAEIWRPIPDWPAYRVSSLGRILSRWERVTGGRRGEMRMGDVWKERATYPNKDGHYFFWASNGQTRKMLYLHQVVLWAFAGPRPQRFVACHDDGNPANNHASNLRWDSQRANRLDHFRHAKERCTEG